MKHEMDILSVGRSRQLLPDGPELIERFIAAEGDVSSRRSAFLFLYNEAEELAIDFLNDHMEDVRQQTGLMDHPCTAFAIVSYRDGDGLCVPSLGMQISGNPVGFSVWGCFLGFRFFAASGVV